MKGECRDPFGWLRGRGEARGPFVQAAGGGARYAWQGPPLERGLYAVLWRSTPVGEIAVGDPPPAQPCPPVPPDLPPARTPESSGGGAPPFSAWEMRDGWVPELGAGPWGSFWASGAHDGPHGTQVGAALVFGFHHVRRPSGQALLGDADGLRWGMAPVTFGCAVLPAVLMAPPDTWLGNELGVDVEVGLAASSDFRILAKPHLSYSRGPFRTPTFFGSLMPYVGVEWRSDRGTSLLVGVPLDTGHWLASSPIAVTVEPLRMGAYIPLDRALPAGVEATTEVSMRWAL